MEPVYSLLLILEAFRESVLEKGGKERSEARWEEIHEIVSPSISRKNYMVL